MYIKPKIFLREVAMPDFRTSHELCPEAEARRMSREKIPPKAAVTEVGPFWSNERMGNRYKSRLVDLLKFFTPERLEKLLVPIISVTSDISLRALDWLVINRAKRLKIALVTHKRHIVNVYANYRAWLQHWNRGLFDAFRRGSRIYFECRGYTYSTTVAQLNFLYWASVVGVLEYANNNIAEIETDMIDRIAECRATKTRHALGGGKYKRSELSQASHIKCAIYELPCTITFG